MITRRSRSADEEAAAMRRRREKASVLSVQINYTARIERLESRVANFSSSRIPLSRFTIELTRNEVPLRSEATSKTRHQLVRNTVK